MDYVKNEDLKIFLKLQNFLISDFRSWNTQSYFEHNLFLTSSLFLNLLLARTRNGFLHALKESEQ